MHDYNVFNKAVFKIYLAIPFLLELKTISDWTFTKTALDIFQWFKLANAHADFFVAKCNNKDYMEHKLGDKIPKWMKFLIGVLGIIGVILLIAGPLLLFSNFNPIALQDKIKSSSLTFSIVLQK